MLVALDAALSKPRQIVIAGKKDAPETKALLREVNRHFLPKTVLVLADGAEGQKYLGEKNEAIRAMSPIDGKSAAYVCENFTCKAPVTDPAELAELLQSCRVSRQTPARESGVSQNGAGGAERDGRAGRDRVSGS